MTQHPLYALRARVLHLAFVYKTPALYEHHIELMHHFHALDCTEPDSIFVWQVYEKASKAHRKARHALRRYIESVKLYEQHQLERAG